jgi:hypothetical protein
MPGFFRVRFNFNHSIATIRQNVENETRYSQTAITSALHQLIMSCMIVIATNPGRTGPPDSWCLLAGRN